LVGGGAYSGLAKMEVRLIARTEILGILILSGIGAAIS